MVDEVCPSSQTSERPENPRPVGRFLGNETQAHNALRVLNRTREAGKNGANEGIFVLRDSAVLHA
jgi:hypothetical protein